MEPDDAETRASTPKKQKYFSKPKAAVDPSRADLAA
jgi:hypothetical protein